MCERRDDRGSRGRRPRTKLRRALRLLLVTCVGGALLVVGLAAGFFFLLQRGDLDHVIEGFISSALTVPVRIESVDSEPFSRLTLTRLRSVSAEAGDKLRFAADEISVYYDPVELLRGEIRKVHFQSPSLSLDLDADLGEVVQVPQVPAPEGPRPRGAEPISPFSLPFIVHEVVVESGEASVRLEGRDTPLKRLRIRLFGVGTEERQSYSVEAEILGAGLMASGSLELLPASDGISRYRLRGGRVVLSGFPATELLGRFLPASRQLSGEGELEAGLASIVQAGVLDLEGSLDGVWPEKLSLELETSAVKLAAGDPHASLGIEHGDVTLRLRADLDGHLRRVGFSLDAQAGGQLASEVHSDQEAATLRAEGHLARLENEGWELVLQHGEMGLAGGGRLTFHGSLAAPSTSAPSEVNLQLTLGEVKPQKVLPYLPEQFSGSLPLRVDGERGSIEGYVRLGGSFASLEADGRLELRGVALPLARGEELLATDARIGFSGLRIDREAGKGRIEVLRITTSPFEIAGARGALARHLPDLSRLEGQSSLELVLKNVELARNRIRAQATAEATLKGGSVELGDEAQGIFGVEGSATFRVALDSASPALPFSAAARVRAEEFLLGDIYAELADEDVTALVEGRVSIDDWRLESLELTEGNLRTPWTGPVTLKGEVRRGDDAEYRVSARAQAPGIPTPRAFSTFLKEPYSNIYSILENGRLSGQSALAVTVNGPLSAPVVHGRFRLEKGTATAGQWTLDGLEIDLPFRIPPLVGDAPSAGWPRDPGSLAVQHLRNGPLAVEDLRLPLRLSPQGYELQGKATIAIFGGSTEIDSLAFLPWGTTGPRCTANIRGRGISLGEFTRAYELPVIPGTLDFDFGPLRYRDGALDVGGSVIFNAFGGRLTLSNLSIEDVLEPYSSLRLRHGRLEALRLGELGKTFHFGLMNGVLRGQLEDLEITGGELSAFRLDVETVPTRGVRQFVDRRAVESLRRVLEGQFGALEDSLFSTFHYARFGFHCELEADTLRLRGKYRDDGVEYLMYGHWYQFPRIDIVNARPGRDYDWKTILGSLEAIYMEDLGE